MSSLLRANWLAGIWRNRRASASTAADRSSGPCTDDTRPILWAVSASIARPVSRNCLACSRPRRYTHNIVVGVPNIRLGAYPMWASEAMNNRSAHKIKSVAPPTAHPRISPITGFGHSQTFMKRRTLFPMNW